jgi:hypothetical protein
MNGGELLYIYIYIYVPVFRRKLKPDKLKYYFNKNN